jgi:predicted transposase YdaD
MALEEAERKRQEMLEAQKDEGTNKNLPSLDTAMEMNKTKEQLEEEMKISLNIRIKPLDLEYMDSVELRNKEKQR